MFVAFYFVVNNHDPINLDRIMTTRFSSRMRGANDLESRKCYHLLLRAPFLHLSDIFILRHK